jgi:outer membrane lipoprotein SlyB
MNPSIKLASAVVALSAVLAGCASPGYGPQQQTYQGQGQSQSYPNANRGYATMYGVVDSIQVVQAPATSGPGLGAVAGAVVGGLLGNTVGGGSGRAVATVGGAVAGGLVGNNLENRNRAAGPSTYQIGVRLDDGTYTTISQDSAADLGIGNRVRIDSGRVYRY